MILRKLSFTTASLVFLCALAFGFDTTAFAQGHYGGEDGRGRVHGGRGDGHRDRGKQGGGYGGGYRGGSYGYRHGYRNDGLVHGIMLGAAIGSYGGRPYYCRHHRHWRWNRRWHRYVYFPRGGYC